MVSSVMYAGPVRVNGSDPTAPTTDGATWGGKSGPPILTEGATWGSESIETPTQQGAYHQRIIDLMKSLGRGLVNLVEGATWG